MRKRQVWFPLSLLAWRYWLPMLTTGVLVTGILFFVTPILAGLAAIITLACMLFFRDPLRTIPASPGLMVSPADGKIVEITRLPEYEGLSGPALRIGIFLSVLDVHINRSPCAGVVASTHFTPGEFLDARNPQAGLRNQANTLVLNVSPAAEHPPVAIVRQIVGAIARRIICAATAGTPLQRGERFGIIVFGSRTELIVPNPEAWECLVHIGQQVRGGASALLRRR
ncbi:MAG: phosphatidylserine decarboxylase [Phycisphaerae bacterium]